MKISPININYQRTAVHKQAPVTPLNTIRTGVSFKARSTYEKEVEERKEEIMKEKKMSGWKKFWGGEYEAEQQAIKEIDQRNLNLKLDKARNEAIIAEQRKYQAQQAEYIKAIQMQQGKTEELVRTLRASTEQTIAVQQSALEAQSKARETIQEQLNNYQKVMKEQAELQEQKNEKTRELMEKINQANTEQNKQLAEMYKIQLEKMQSLYASKIGAKQEEVQDISNAARLYKLMHTISEQNGFGRIAGYQKEKDLLIELVGNAIITEYSGKQADVVNGILFYGPKGNGKTTFAKAFAEQLGCRLEKVINYINPTKNMEKLQAQALKAKEVFETDGVRTILYLDEINGFAPKDSKIVPLLKDLLDELSEEYHCTLFATTNFPEKMDDTLLRDGRFSIKVGLAPSDRDNAEAVLMHYGKQYADDSVDFGALAEVIIGEMPEKAFSNARIKAVVENFIKVNSVSKMSHQDFLNSIKGLGADITKDALELFERQRKYVKYL